MSTLNRGLFSFQLRFPFVSSLFQFTEPLSSSTTSTSPLAPLPKWSTRRGGLSNPFQKQAAPLVKATSVKSKKDNKTPVTAVAKVDPAVAYSTAVRRTILAVGAACAFGGGLWYIEGKKSAMEFFAGYLIEESLSVDNIFVFIMLFEYFKVRRERGREGGREGKRERQRQRETERESSRALGFCRIKAVDRTN